MKKILVLPLLLLAGCSRTTPSNTVEAKLNLTPLPAAPVNAPKSAIPADPQSTAWEKKLNTLRTSPEIAKALKEVQLWQQRAQIVTQRVSRIKDKATRKRLLHQQAQISSSLKSLERAVLIKQAQIKSKDFADSTGEVAKYLGQSHQFRANATKIMRSTGNASCCGTSSRP